MKATKPSRPDCPMSARITKYGDDYGGGVIVGKHYKGDSGADVEGTCKEHYDQGADHD